jgi:hypothetical protein
MNKYFLIWLVVCAISCVQASGSKPQLGKVAAATLDTAGLKMGVRHVSSEAVDTVSKTGELVAHHTFYVDIDLEDPERLKGLSNSYLDHEIQKDFLMVSGDQESLPVFCQRVVSGRGNNLSYMVVFETKGSVVPPLKFVYHDNTLGIGDQFFQFMNL